MHCLRGDRKSQVRKKKTEKCGKIPKTVRRSQSDTACRNRTEHHICTSTAVIRFPILNMWWQNFLQGVLMLLCELFPETRAPFFFVVSKLQPPLSRAAVVRVRSCSALASLFRLKTSAANWRSARLNQWERTECRKSNVDNGGANDLGHMKAQILPFLLTRQHLRNITSYVFCQRSSKMFNAHSRKEQRRWRKPHRSLAVIMTSECNLFFKKSHK